jgi:hypothetical protein
MAAAQIPACPGCASRDRRIAALEAALEEIGQPLRSCWAATMRSSWPMATLPWLAPDIQEAVLAGPPDGAGGEQALREVAAEACWSRQQVAWDARRPAPPT